MNVSSFFRGFAVCGAASLVVLGLGAGCAVIDSHQDVYLSGRAVAEETLSRVQVGETSEAWVVAALGEASRADQVDETTRLLTYESKRITRTDTELLFVIDASGRKEEMTRVVFEFKDGVLARYWRETSKSKGT